MRFLLTSICLFIFTAPIGFTHAQTFMLDDCPSTPLTGPLGFGCGAEDPWGLGVPTGSPGAPSPLLLPLALFDGDFLVTGVVVTATPGLPYTASLSDISNGGPLGATFEYNLFFSVDRVSRGAVPGGVATQAGLNQQPGDIYRGLTSHLSPRFFFGAMAGLPSPFAGAVASTVVPIFGNVLAIDDSVLALPLAGVPGVLTGPAGVGPALGPGTHNNIDGFDFTTGIATAGVINTPVYQTVYPDLAVPLGLPTGDIYDMTPGGTTFCGLPAFATGAQMGLIDGDVVDALVMFDTPPVGSPLCGGPGVQPGRDGVLFSLAPGSPSLTQPGVGLNPGDVMISDFSGNFGLYAGAGSMGLRLNPGGSPFSASDNVDALEFRCLGDFTGDGVVNFGDFVIFVAAFGGLGGVADINGDGVVNFADLSRFAANFGCTGG